MRRCIKELPEISSAEKVHLFEVSVTAQFGFWVFATNNRVYFFRDINNIWLTIDLLIH